jgi:hypothetical protein
VDLLSVCEKTREQSFATLPHLPRPPSSFISPVEVDAAKKIECTNFFLAESAKDFFGANTFFQFHALQLLSCQSMFRLKARNVVLEEALSW